MSFCGELVWGQIDFVGRGVEVGAAEEDGRFGPEGVY